MSKSAVVKQAVRYAETVLCMEENNRAEEREAARRAWKEFLGQLEGAEREQARVAYWDTYIND